MGEEQPINIETELISTPLAINVPLFLRKLWKMVNDENAQDIISWNDSGDGFIIHDQLQFISVLLPQYFKHNNMASFVRQLNFYDFHKVANIDKEEIHFAHNYFLKDLPQTLAFIKRKCTQTTRIRRISNNLTEILDNIKDLKGKHEVVNSELQRIQQENETLWEELNSLRVKHSKQCKIINKLIHFLISYMQSRSVTAKRSRSGTKKNSSPKRLRSTPRLLEIGYRRNQKNVSDEDTDLGFERDQTKYTVTEPNDPNDDIDRCEKQNFENQDFQEPNTSETTDLIHDVIQPINTSRSADTSSGQVIQQFMSSVTSDNTKRNKIGQSSVEQVNALASSSRKNNFESQPSISQPSSSLNIPSTKPTSRPPIPLNFKEKPKENFGLYIDNTQVKLESIQDILHNLTPNDLASFYEILEDNFNHEFDLGVNSNAEMYEMEHTPVEEELLGSPGEIHVDIPSSPVTELYKSITDKSESEPVQIMKKEIEEELEKELAGMEVLSQFQPDTSTAEGATAADMSVVASALDYANTSNNSDDVSNIIEGLISDTNIAADGDPINMEKALEKELAEIVAVANIPASNLSSEHNKLGTNSAKGNQGRKP